MAHPFREGNDRSTRLCKTLLKAALTDQVNDREAYRKGVDASYRYEGYDVYRTADNKDESSAEKA